MEDVFSRDTFQSDKKCRRFINILHCTLRGKNLPLGPNWGWLVRQVDSIVYEIYFLIYYFNHFICRWRKLRDSKLSLHGWQLQLSCGLWSIRFWKVIREVLYWSFSEPLDVQDYILAIHFKFGKIKTNSSGQGRNRFSLSTLSLSLLPFLPPFFSLNNFGFIWTK